jgi:hypothetical protein
VLTLGDRVKVVYLGKDRQGRDVFSMKDVKNAAKIAAKKEDKQ